MAHAYRWLASWSRAPYHKPGRARSWGWVRQQVRYLNKQVATIKRNQPYAVLNQYLWQIMGGHEQMTGVKTYRNYHEAVFDLAVGLEAMRVIRECKIR